VRPRDAFVKVATVSGAALALLFASASAAWAQVIVSPNASPTKNDGGWIYWIAVALAALGVLVALIIVFGYMRYAPRFQRDEEARPSVKAPRIQPGEEAPRRPVNITGTPVVVPAPTVAVVAAPAAVAPAPAAVSSAPAPAAVVAPAPAAAPTPAASAQAPAAQRTAAPAAPAAEAAAERTEVALDQETFDRVFAELLEKGTTRRVAEGQARRAAMIAARKKAAGG
jgi:hypothetical protein